jgi:hypothetical protein
LAYSSWSSIAMADATNLTRINSLASSLGTTRELGGWQEETWKKRELVCCACPDRQPAESLTSAVAFMWGGEQGGACRWRWILLRL